MVEIDRDIGGGGVAENAFETTICGGFDGGVDLFLGGGALGDEFQIDDGDVWCRDADGGAVELAIEFGQDETYGLRGTGRGRDHGECCGATAIEILVHGIEGRLITRVGVDRCHHAAFNADEFVENLRNGRKAIGGARRIRDDEMVFGEFLMVDAENDREIGVISRSGHKNALGAGSEMGGCLVARREDACAFERDINAEFLVRKLGGIAHGGDLDRAATNIDRVA